MMDQKTIKVLLTEAKKNLHSAEKRIQKYDNYEDFADLETWSTTVSWLESKIKTGT